MHKRVARVGHCLSRIAAGGVCRVRARPILRVGQGFTLVELLVVLCVVGLLSGMVFPNIKRYSEGLAFRFDRARVLHSLDSLSERVYRAGAGIKLVTPESADMLYKDGAPVLALPPDWQLTILTPVIMEFNGLCGGGSLQLKAPDGTVSQIRLKAPDCRAEVVE
ncbi:prepilin-type N-terminal cleavage/methylation domain-containing protein [Chitinimonas prasina]|uniref:prepilin-type N-terminal cleavage/methylation domain-containing protein n=1 Tax=Chitinimonas prasina TaxID=1434937 RepID=UPI0024E13B22|nr:prepilin-type N-terminal cleavage/methylation domain-containing protein [Chitinimonas prasina]